VATFAAFTTKEEAKVRKLFLTKDVEAVEYFLLQLPAPYKVSRFRVCFRFQLLSSKCFCLHKNLTASTASAFLPHVLRKMLPLPTPQKSNASEFVSASSFFLKSASAYTKNLTASRFRIPVFNKLKILTLYLSYSNV